MRQAEQIEKRVVQSKNRTNKPFQQDNCLNYGNSSHYYKIKCYQTSKKTSQQQQIPPPHRQPPQFPPILKRYLPDRDERNSSYNINPMINIFKSRQYRKVYALLQTNGLHGEDFKHYRMAEIARKITQQPSSFPALTRNLLDIKLAPLRLLKTLILVQHLLQIDPRLQQNPTLLQMLQQFSARTRLLLTNSQSRPKTALIVGQPDGQFPSASEMKVWAEGEEDGASLFLGKIILPLLQLQERIIYSYEVVYRTQTEIELSGCWATLNLLRKFVEISPNLQEIGRYYFEQYASGTICLMKVLDHDIQTLYTRIKDFLNRRVTELQASLSSDKIQKHKLKIEQLLQLVDQLEEIHELLRLLYGNRYFKMHFVANGICQPELFTNSQFDHFYQMRNQFARRDRRCKNNSREVFPSRRKNQRYAIENLADL